jgi:hypothetical protein
VWRVQAGGAIVDARVMDMLVKFSMLSAVTTYDAMLGLLVSLGSSTFFNYYMFSSFRLINKIPF